MGRLHHLSRLVRTDSALLGESAGGSHLPHSLVRSCRRISHPRRADDATVFDRSGHGDGRHIAATHSWFAGAAFETVATTQMSSRAAMGWCRTHSHSKAAIMLSASNSSSPFKTLSSLSNLFFCWPLLQVRAV